MSAAPARQEVGQLCLTQRGWGCFEVWLFLWLWCWWWSFVLWVCLLDHYSNKYTKRLKETEPSGKYSGEREVVFHVLHPLHFFFFVHERCQLSLSLCLCDIRCCLTWNPSSTCYRCSGFSLERKRPGSYPSCRDSQWQPKDTRSKHVFFFSFLFLQTVVFIYQDASVVRSEVSEAVASADRSNRW